MGDVLSVEDAHQEPLRARRLWFPAVAMGLTVPVGVKRLACIHVLSHQFKTLLSRPGFVWRRVFRPVEIGDAWVAPPAVLVALHLNRPERLDAMQRAWLDVMDLGIHTITAVIVHLAAASCLVVHERNSAFFRHDFSKAAI
ncbi:hypothetical protein D3C80_1706200 [compost metagenome]